MLNTTAVVEGVGLTDVNIAVNWTSTGAQNYQIGALSGHSWGTVRYVYATGTLTVTIPTPATGVNERTVAIAGGLLGSVCGRVDASWADVDVTVSSVATHNPQRGRFPPVGRRMRPLRPPGIVV